MPPAEAELAASGLELGAAIPPIGQYSPVTVAGSTAYTSGVVALQTPGFQLLYPGRLGADLDVAQGKLAARGAMLCTLANLRAELGSLDRIARFLKITGYIQTEASVLGLPAVLDGASEVLSELFPEEPLPARCAVGVYALPGGASVEIDCVVLLR
jgi:enamine deaminase RidA (YjgF/YER057c/UK114 family)